MHDEELDRLIAIHDTACRRWLEELQAIESYGLTAAGYIRTYGHSGVSIYQADIACLKRKNEVMHDTFLAIHVYRIEHGYDTVTTQFSQV